MDDLPDGVADARYRCRWGRGPDPEYRAYHDLEWGVPVRDERHLFELLILEAPRRASPGPRSCGSGQATGARSTGSTRR